MDAILAIIVDGGRAITVIDREGLEINYFLLWFIDSTKTLRWQPCPISSKEAPRGGVCVSIKTMLLEAETAPSWWGCLCASSGFTFIVAFDLSTQLIPSMS